MVTGSQPYSETCLGYIIMRHTNPWHIHSPGIYQLSPWHSVPETHLVFYYLPQASYLIPNNCRPQVPSVRVGNSKVNLSPTTMTSLFDFSSLHTMVLSLKQISRPGKLALEYHHARDLYCHKHCCFMTLDVPSCRTLVPPVTTSIMHQRPLWHEITCIHLSW